jgi:DNA-binding NarL/FixJ family response regulator
MKILICSTNAATRERWQQILQDEYALLEAESLQEILTNLAQQKINLILLHRSMIDLDFIAQLKNAQVFIFSDLPDDNEAYSLLRAGAIGYANTYISAVRLKEAVNLALAGKVWVGQKLMRKIIQGATSIAHKSGTLTPPPHDLSDREWEVALRVSKGWSNLAIAAELNISERTVKAHIGSIFKKTKTESRLQLALYVKETLLQQS